MKPPKIALLFWTINAALLALAFVLVQASFSSARATRIADTEMQPKPAPRVNWESQAREPGLQIGDAQLSPRARPQPPKQPVVEIPVTKPEPTDAELMAELQASLNKRYRLQRTITWVAGGDKPGAFVECKGLRLFLFEGMNLKDLAGKEAGAASDVEVKAIRVDHVLVNAPSLRDASKRFDVKLTLPTDSGASFKWSQETTGMTIVPVNE
ncbi:MAG: hypothetical protein IPP14_10150 [Planctomycetes bacterium]|nr:hypothetical protein [Planctomycetota bacterium]